MIVVGAMVLAERCFRGPLRFAALGSGFAVPLLITLRPPGRTASNLSFGLTTCALFFALALAIYRAGRNLE